ncbi:MAG: hypothetical protein AB7J28_10185 [Hyphomonadaceae bacterium]
MQEIFWFIDSVRAFFEGGMAAVRQEPGFWILLIGAALLVPSTIIFMAVTGDDFHETPLGRWFGVAPPDEGWPPPMSVDIDGDGRLDA